MMDRCNRNIEELIDSEMVSTISESIFLFVVGKEAEKRKGLNLNSNFYAAGNRAFKIYLKVKIL